MVTYFTKPLLLIGAFDNRRDQIRRLIAELLAAGLTVENIVLVGEDPPADERGEERIENNSPTETTSSVPTETSHGAIAGGVAGGVAGVALAVAASGGPLAVPLLLAAPVACALGGVGLGVLIGTVADALESESDETRKSVERFERYRDENHRIVVIDTDELNLSRFENLFRAHQVIEMEARQNRSAAEDIAPVPMHQDPLSNVPSFHSLESALTGAPDSPATEGA
ncbi:MAG: hypothetical protein IT290_11815 [Deltaproteobacteria bacterium]|nr:hypothetical protein [Deltaproteobacteria bacterium]